MSMGQLIIGHGKIWIALERLLKQWNRLEQALFLWQTDNGRLDELFGSSVKVKCGEVGRGLFFNGCFLFGRKLTFELGDDLLVQLGLDSENIGQAAIVLFGPNVHVGARID